MRGRYVLVTRFPFRFLICGIPRSATWIELRVAARSRAVSFLPAASRLTWSPSASPSQPFDLASLMRSLRLWVISFAGDVGGVRPSRPALVAAGAARGPAGTSLRWCCGVAAGRRSHRDARAGHCVRRPGRIIQGPLLKVQVETADFDQDEQVRLAHATPLLPGGAGSGRPRLWNRGGRRKPTVAAVVEPVVLHEPASDVATFAGGPHDRGRACARLHPSTRGEPVPVVADLSRNAGAPTWGPIPGSSV